MANKIRDLTGQRFGRLTAITISTKTPKIMWACVCDCGGEKSVPSGQLTGGQVKSCGCLLRGPKDTWKSVLGVVESGWTCLEYVNTTKQGHVFLWQHVCGRTLKTTRFKIKGGRIALCRCTPKVKAERPGKLHVPTRNTHKAMLARCLNKAHEAFNRYGGVGINVDPRWLDYDNFVLDMGLRPAGKELDRCNNEMGYTKENCRWVSRSINLRNTSVNRMFEYEGRTLCVAEIAEIAGIPYPRAWRRLVVYGWTVEQTLRGSR